MSIFPRFPRDGGCKFVFFRYTRYMRKPRFTFQGGLHHVISRGLEGKNIFQEPLFKKYFLKILNEESKRKKIRIFAFCIMDNHYHLVIENTSGMMPQFMREVNGRYGKFYRYKEGGKGYVFQNRYKSILIEDDSYLKMAIVYVLLNPVRAKIVEDPFNYPWSSIGEYFTDKDSSIVDIEYVNEIFYSKGEFKKMLNDWVCRDQPLVKTDLGLISGSEGFYPKAISKFNRRKNIGKTKGFRKNDYNFISPEKIIKEFEIKNGISIDEIDVTNFSGKRLRAELLITLKEQAGLTYKEIKNFPIFNKLKYSSLGKIYKNRKKLKKNI